MQALISFLKSYNNQKSHTEEHDGQTYTYEYIEYGYKMHN